MTPKKQGLPPFRPCHVPDSQPLDWNQVHCLQGSPDIPIGARRNCDSPSAPDRPIRGGAELIGSMPPSQGCWPTYRFQVKPPTRRRDAIYSWKRLLPHPHSQRKLQPTPSFQRPDTFVLGHVGKSSSQVPGRGPGEGEAQGMVRRQQARWGVRPLPAGRQLVQARKVL